MEFVVTVYGITDGMGNFRPVIFLRMQKKHTTVP